MKILLTTLNAKYIHSNLAIRYLYAAAEERISNLSIREFTINNDMDYIFTELLRGEYDVVGFSCYIWNIEYIVKIAENLKKAVPHIKLLLGGPEVSFDTLHFMETYPFVDFIIQGEGEEGFCQLAEKLVEGSHELGKIKGLAYRHDGKICVNPVTETIDFEKIVFPYDKLVCESDKVIYYESTRGCPYQCAYCLSSIEKRIRTLPMERIKSELSYFIHKGVKQVKFIDRTFNWNKVRTLEILKFLMDRDNGVTNFHCEICADLIDEGFLDLLQKARKDLFQFEIGVQSTNKKTLRACNRNSDFPTLRKNVKGIIQLKNTHVHVDLIAGLPYEDYHSFRDSFNNVYELGAENLQLGFLKLLKGTPIREKIEEYGYVYRAQPPYEVISNEYLSAQELVKLKMIEKVLDLYHNRGGFENTLAYFIDQICVSPFH
ncbi:MAG: radical SAM protein, partial [Anaerovorax sp.]